MDHPHGGIVVEVAAADHLARVEQERDALRFACREVLALLPPLHDCPDRCWICSVRQVIDEVLP